MSQGGHSEQLSFFALYYQSTPSCLKVVGGWVAHVIIESAQGPNPSFFLFIRLLFDLGACWDQDLDQGLTIPVPHNILIHPSPNFIKITVTVNKADMIGETMQCNAMSSLTYLVLYALAFISVVML